MTFSPAWRARVRHARPHVVAVAWRTCLMVAGLTLFYLGAANFVLATPLLRTFVATSDDLCVTYDSAYSVWPGRIEVKNLGVRFEDHDVQFFVGIERGTLDVTLHELFLRRFHVKRLDGHNVTYRMRHKLHAVDKDGPRVAAYPPIAGLADAPVYTRAPRPPIPDSEYALWNVKIERVTARIKEIWILEYRYRGPGVARGTFHVMPARYYDVQNATLDLDGGKLTLGDKVVAESALAHIACTVSGSDPRSSSGLEPLRAISARVDGRFNQSNLAFVDAYLGPHTGWSAGGRGDIDVHVGIRDGAIAPEARIVATSHAAWLGNGSFRVRGPAVWRLESLDQPQGALALGFSANGLAIEGAEPAAEQPRVEHVDLRVRTTGDLTRPIEVLSAELRKTRITVPDLGWIGRTLRARDVPLLGGRANLTLAAKREADGRSDAHFELETADTTLGLAERKSKPFAASLTSKLSADAGATDVHGVAALYVDRASALLPLLSESAFLRELELKLLRLDVLAANGTYRVGKHPRFDLIDARSGIARARGYVTAETPGPRGAFLVLTPAANLGVRIAPSKTRVRLHVADDWLETGASITARGVLARPERGRSSR